MHKILKNKKGGADLLTFIVIIAVSAGLIMFSYGGMSNATKKNVDIIAKSYNSTDTIILE